MRLIRLTSRMLRPALLTVVLLAACSDPEPAPRPAPEEPVAAPPPPVARPGELRIKADLDGVRHTALLRSQGSGPRMWKLVELDPAPRGPIEVAQLEWVFCALPVHSDLETPDGRVLGHPDRGLLSELLDRASASPPDVDAVLAEMPRLLRCESRAQLFARLAGQDALGAARLDRLIDAATAPAGEGLLRPDPSGAGPGGDAPEALAIALSSLADRFDIDRQRADRLARACARVEKDGLVRDVLTRLIAGGRAGSAAIVEAALAALDSPENRAAILLELARRRDAKTDLREVARAAPRIGNDASEAEVLLELGKRGVETQPLVEAVKQGLVAPTTRHAVLLALAKRSQPGLDVQLIAQAVPAVGQDALEAELYEVLGRHPGSTATVLAAAETSVLAPAGRRRVLMALADREQGPGDAVTLASRVQWIAHDPHEAEVLALMARGPLPVDAILAAVRRSLDTPGPRAQVLDALCGRMGLSAAEAIQVALCVPEVGQDSLEERLLVKLVPKMRSPELVVATERALQVRETRRPVLQAIARRDDLSRAEADHLAAHAPRLLDTAGAAAVLIDLIGKASPEAISSSAEALSDPQARARVAQAQKGRRS